MAPRAKFHLSRAGGPSHRRAGRAAQGHERAVAFRLERDGDGRLEAVRRPSDITCARLNWSFSSRLASGRSAPTSWLLVLHGVVEEPVDDRGRGLHARSRTTGFRGSSRRATGRTPRPGLAWISRATPSPSIRFMVRFPFFLFDNGVSRRAAPKITTDPGQVRASPALLMRVSTSSVGTCIPAAWRGAAGAAYDGRRGGADDHDL